MGQQQSKSIVLKDLSRFGMVKAEYKVLSTEYKVGMELQQDGPHPTSLESFSGEKGECFWIGRAFGREDAGLERFRGVARQHGYFVLDDDRSMVVLVVHEVDRAAGGFCA